MFLFAIYCFFTLLTTEAFSAEVGDNDRNHRIFIGDPMGTHCQIINPYATHYRLGDRWPTHSIVNIPGILPVMKSIQDYYTVGAKIKRKCGKRSGLEKLLTYIALNRHTALHVRPKRGQEPLVIKVDTFFKKKLAKVDPALLDFFEKNEKVFREFCLSYETTSDGKLPKISQLMREAYNTSSEDSITHHYDEFSPLINKKSK